MKLEFSHIAVFVLLGAALLTIGLAQPAPAAASGPIITPVPSEDFGFDGCGFPVWVHFTALKEYDKLYTSNGSLADIITGVDKVQLTNLVNQKSIYVNISSASQEHDYADGSGTLNITGPTLFSLNNPPPGLPALFVFSGLWHIQWDPAQNYTFSYEGKITDLCQALQ